MTKPTLIALCAGFLLSFGIAAGQNGSDGGGGTGSNAAGRNLGQVGGAANREGSDAVEFAQPTDLAFLIFQTLSETATDTAYPRLADALALEDAFAARGLFVGPFQILSTVDTGVVGTDNAGGGRTEQERLGLLLSPELVGSTAWDRHQIGFDLRGTYLRSPDELFSETSFIARAGGRYDLSERTAAGGIVAYRFISEGLEEEIVPSGAAIPATQNVTTRVRLSHRRREWAVAFEGQNVRNRYNFGDTGEVRTDVVRRVDGRLFRRINDDVTAYADAGLTYLNVIDDSRGPFSGREAPAYLIGGGGIVDLAPSVIADLRIGRRFEQFAEVTGLDTDDRSAWTLDAAVIYAPATRHRLRAALSSRVTTSGLEGAFARTVDAGRFAWETRPRDDLRLSAGGGYAFSDYRGLERADTTASVFALADHDLSRRAAIVLRYDFERTTSSLDTVSQTENRLAAILRLRR